MTDATPQALPFSRATAVLILLALSLVIYVGNAARPGLLDAEDSGHAVAAQEILESGDWAVLHMNGIRYLEKAPLHYWLIAASLAAFGNSAFAVRLPLALSVAGLVLMVYVFARRFFGDRAGFYAGLVMCTSIGTYMFTRITIPEAIYALQFSAAFYLFLRGWTGSLPLRPAFWGAAALVGLAVITRAVIGILFPVAIIALFVMLTGRRYSWREMPVISSLLIFSAVAVPWHLIAGLRAAWPGHHGFFWYYFMNEQALRAIGARYPHDFSAVPLGLWWAAHLVWLFPWSIFLPLAFRSLPRPREWHRLDASGQAVVFLCAWTAVIFVFFSFTASRMEYYSFAAWPALAMLLGRGLAAAEEERAAWLQRLQGGVAMLGAATAAVLGWLLWVSRGVPVQGDIDSLFQLKESEFYRVAMASFFDLTPRAFAVLRAPSALAAILFLFGFGGVYWMRRRGWNLGANVALSAVMGGFFFAANLAYQVFEPHMSSKPLADALAPHLRPSDALVLYGEYYGGCALGFYTHRQVLLFNGRHGALEFGSYYPDAPKIFLDDHDFPGLWNGPRRVFLFVPPHEKQGALVRLPAESTYVLAESGGKTILVNQPLRAGQPSLAQRAARGDSPASMRP
jgi:4-amino-4-deoxy-L-arabinose transferase-like glycosyltransferase